MNSCDMWFSMQFDAELENQAIVEQVVDLGSGTELWGTVFMEGEVFDCDRRLAGEQSSGVLYDYAFMACGIPVVSHKLVQVFRSWEGNDLQLLPVLIDDVKWYIVNVISVVDCLQPCDVQPCEPAGFNRELDLGFRMFRKQCVDPTAIPSGVELLRLKDAMINILVSGRVRKDIEDAGVRGMLFECVSCG